MGLRDPVRWKMGIRTDPDWANLARSEIERMSTYRFRPGSIWSNLVLVLAAAVGVAGLVYMIANVSDAKLMFLVSGVSLGMAGYVIGWYRESPYHAAEVSRLKDVIKLKTQENQMLTGKLVSELTRVTSLEGKVRYMGEALRSFGYPCEDDATSTAVAAMEIPPASPIPAPMESGEDRAVFRESRWPRLPFQGR
jgi:hypothetical protein